MKWTLYLGKEAVREGRFDSRREAIRAARHSTDEAPFFFLIGRQAEADPARRLIAYLRDETELFHTTDWTLGTEVDIIQEVLP